MQRWAINIVCIAIVLAVSYDLYRVLNKDSNAVLQRAKEFQQAEYSHNAEKIWDMMLPSIRQDSGPKEEYIANVKAFYASLNDIKADKPTLVTKGDKWAMTQEDITATFPEPDGVQTDCFRTVWLKSEGVWYWYETDRACTYMPDASEIVHITKNLK